MAYGRILPVLLTAAVTATLVATAPAQAGPARPAVSWTDCDNGFECATVPAPLDYDHPRGARIGLSLIRLPATDPAARIGSLLVNPGGPGGSGVDFVRTQAGAFPKAVRARFDIVGFDPRGIYRSAPLLCFDTAGEADAVLPPVPYPDSPDEEEQQRVSDDTLAAACDRHGGAILGHMSTADVARDLDLLRRALGDRKLTYLGYSYGSVLGETYANMFPDRFRALVIDGVVDPVAWATGRGGQAGTTPLGARIESADGAARTLAEFFRLCDAAGPDCAFSGGAAQRFADVARQLRGHPVTLVDPLSARTVRFTDNQLIAVTLGVLYVADVWPVLASYLDAVQRQLPPATLGKLLSAIRAGLGIRAVEQTQYANDVEGAPGVACADTLNPREFAAWQRTADDAEQRYGYFGRIWDWTWSPCRSWPAKAAKDAYRGPWSAHTKAPVLVVGNYFDPATRYQGAVAASRLLPHSRLLSYAGWGHAAFYIAGNDCVNDQVGQYLISGRTPPPGTLCSPDGSPFDPKPATLASAAARPALDLPEASRRAFF